MIKEIRICDQIKQGVLTAAELLTRATRCGEKMVESKIAKRIPRELTRE